MNKLVEVFGVRSKELVQHRLSGCKMSDRRSVEAKIKM